MNGEASGSNLTGELHAINREFSTLLGVAPCALSFGADAARKDDLVLCGILGGKDVGKSTLINTLAQTNLSEDSEEVGKGTDRPMIFVHESAESAAQSRLQEVGRHMPVDLRLHRADSVRNAVLIDMPDFDSDFADHRRIVQRVTPLLDRVLWVQTPRKVADRQWVEMGRDVFKDARNIYFVLNKLDELLCDGDPFALPDNSSEPDIDGPAAVFRREQDQWFAQSLEAAGASASAEHRFLISAAFPVARDFVARIAQRWDDPDWTRYARDREAVERCAELVERDIIRLRGCVLSELSGEQARVLKAANRAREREAAHARMRKHFDVERIREGLAQACDPEYARHILDESTGDEFCAAAASALASRLRSEKRLADELLERRVEGWPLLRLVHWPLGWLSRLLSLHRLLPAPGSQTPAPVDVSRRPKPAAQGGVDITPPARPLDVGGRPLADRIELLRARILADHAGVAARLAIETMMPNTQHLEKRAAARAESLPTMLEADILDDIRTADRRPSLPAKAGLWLILLWFPVLQPILQGLLEIYVETGAWHTAHGAYRIVAALSAPKLLAGLLVVTAIFVALLAGMYTRALRAVQCARKNEALFERLHLAVNNLLVEEVAVPLLNPFQECLDRINALQQRLDRSTASGDTPA